MNNKTKIALCLSGEPRSSMFCFPYIYESLINLSSKYEVDVYIHSWKSFRALPLYNPKDYLIDWINEEEFYKNFTHKLTINSHLNSSEINQELDYILLNTHNVGILKNTLLMHLSMQSCFNLIKESYDVYIRGRFDYYLQNKINITRFIENIENKKNDIIIPGLYLNNEEGKLIDILFDDKFAVCNLEGAKYYFNLYNDILNLLPKMKSLSPHSLLKSYLNKSNLNIDVINMDSNIDLVRSSRVITMLNEPYFDN